MLCNRFVCRMKRHCVNVRVAITNYWVVLLSLWLHLVWFKNIKCSNRIHTYKHKYAAFVCADTSLRKYLKQLYSNKPMPTQFFKRFFQLRGIAGDIQTQANVLRDGWEWDNKRFVIDTLYSNIGFVIDSINKFAFNIGFYWVSLEGRPRWANRANPL